jgi:hypothetical protein
MNIKKIILIFLLILAIIILLNKKKIGEHLTQNEATQNYFSFIDMQINKKFLNSQICDEQQNCLSFRKMLLLNSPVNQYMYLPKQNIMWNNLDEHKDTKFRVVGAGHKWTTYKHYSKNCYQLDPRLNNPIGTGIEIDVPEFQVDDEDAYVDGMDFTVLWIRLRLDSWSTFRVYAKNEDGKYESFGSYAMRYDALNSISPDGGMQNAEWAHYTWYPIPIKLNKERKVIVNSPYNEGSLWFCGFAFSTNPWNHCKVSASTLYLNLNRDETNTTWGRDQIIQGWYDDWNRHEMGRFTAGNKTTFKIPFVNSGRNKIFYVVEHNETWAPSIISVSVNNTIIGNLYTSFDNPFARHFNSKQYQRYYGAVIPVELIPSGEKYLTITIDTTLPYQNHWGLQTREVGTHDENPFELVKIV